MLTKSAFGLFGVALLLSPVLRAADDSPEKHPSNFHATIKVDFDRARMSALRLDAADYPKTLEDVDHLMSRPGFTLQELENLPIRNSKLFLKNVATIKVALTPDIAPPIAAPAVEAKEPSKAAEIPAKAPVEAVKVDVKPIAKAEVKPEAKAAPNPDPKVEAKAEVKPEPVAPAAPIGFRGRLPNNYSKTGLSEAQRQKIYSIQGSYAARLDALKKELSESTIKRDAEIRAVLSADQQRKLDELSGGAAATKAVKKPADADADDPPPADKNPPPKAPAANVNAADATK